MNYIIIFFILISVYFIYKLRNININTQLTHLIENYTNVKFKSKNSRNINDIDIVINNDIIFQKIISNYEIGFAQSYIDGDWDCNNLEETIFELLSNYDIIHKYIKKHSIKYLFISLKAFLKKINSNNTIEKSKRNIEFHYNIGNDMYKKMLGKHMQYTCAYFNKPNLSLDEAQYSKMELIAKKLNLKAGMQILDIGCGFGSMAYHLANKYKVSVVGVTLSAEQQKYANENFSHPKVSILLKDYRNVQEKFDRVYSVGMFEHVGRKNYKEYYDKCYDLLEDNGIMLLHTIGTSFKIWNNNSFINKYIFPEGELPHLSNMTQKFSDKWILEDFQNFGISYAKTLSCWKENIGQWEGLDNYDTEFRRMWDFYLSGCAATFRIEDTYLWQFVYTKKNIVKSDNLHFIRS
jgi:cyclopropane-fatty-acyl-phospholipid synthase